MRRQTLTFLSLAAADLAGILIALAVGLALRQFLLPLLVPGVFRSDVTWRPEYLWLFAIAIGVLAYEGLYTRRRTAWEELRYILRGVSVSMVLFLAAMTVLKRGEEVSRPALVMAWLAAPGILVWFRLRVKRLLRKSSFWVRRVLLVGHSPEADQLVRNLEIFTELGYEAVGFLCEEKEGASWARRRCGSVGEMEEVVRVRRADEVIIAIPQESRLRQFELLKRAEALVPKVSVLPELFDADKLNVEIDKVERYFLLSFQNNLMKRSNRLLKAVFEILIILATFPLWLPLVTALALAVKTSSPGPVLFRQLRVGEGGKPFWCLKFRTMVADAEESLYRHLAENSEARVEWEAEHKLKDDPRITSVGRFLRQTSLDELPQIFNILRGEMSLVGPRPIVEAEVEKYGEHLRYYHAVCPGLSGLWQVSGRNDVGYQQRVMLDTFYVRNWSLWLDFMILLRTIPAVLKKEGAY
jgi:undecaprenyl-phosphate galactose phosphotransferase